METIPKEEIGEIDKDKYRFDAIVLLGAGIEEKYGNYMPTFDGKMRALAAADILRNKLASTLIVSGGKTSGEDKPSEAKVLHGFLTNRYTKDEGKFKKIPKESIILEEKAVDTSSNIENSMEIIRRNNWKKVIFLTNRYHEPRVKKLAKKFGLDSYVLTAEDEIVRRDRRFGKVVENYYSSAKMKRIKGQEKLLRLLLIIDPKAKLPQLLKSRLKNN